MGALNWRLATLDRLLSNGDIKEGRARLAEVKEIAQKGYAEVREALFTLRSASSLESESLPGLDNFLADYRARHGLDVRLIIDPPMPPRFAMETRLQIVRIVQEALANVQKHAGAERVQITLHQDANETTLLVEDDGRGFDLARLEQEIEGHYGLSIMRQRAASVGGTLTIDSAAGCGTRVRLAIPQAGEAMR